MTEDEKPKQETEPLTRTEDGSLVGEIPEAVGLPVCPHCNAEPLMPSFRPIQIGAVRAVMFFCSACRKPVPLFMLPAMPQQGPRIVRPS